MKKLLRVSYVLVALFASSSACTDDITSINTNPKAYQAGSVQADAFFSNATRNLTDAVVYGFTFKILAQQFSETTYFTTSAYNLVDVGSGFWTSMYRDVLRDYAEAKTVLTNSPSLFPDVDNNKRAIIDIMEVYTYSLLVNTYGNVPYSGAINTALQTKALDSDNLTPAYDDAAAIYDDLFARLDRDLGMLKTSSTSFGTADLIYGGSVAKWVKFANSLKLRMAVTLADVNPTKAKTLAEAAVKAGVFTANSDNAILTYLATTPNTNPIWVGLIQSGREDYVASNTMMNILQAPTVKDPRIPLFYTKDNTGGYTGGIYGRSNAYITYSKAGTSVTAQTTPGVLLSYDEIAFYLAEAAARGYSVGGTAESFYNAGITASILYWGGTAASTTTYLADPAVAYATAIGSTPLQRIARQKYIALYNRGLEAWTEYRRLDYPTLNTPPVPQGDFPVRYTYPNSEQTSNIANYTTAAAAIGSDKLTTKVFWDTK
ncbi:SusD/RagB family nutrient-binding outer membrane lipoprotein [Spirosoma sp. KUDC1026]|uniref:SusD/RagB family nutrient-binding outer membrane lipoprotein n=1 Tax=Spirosoma sp. KUDC1026 TaxID=2745947 RepID=UPI00159B846A|nr:SusD/RagB family nutrient-binding outer membrane lipoprotein [Spirosoma sp. KUDC1026]QKZ13683.1 SusD/RagB family nutrient-binding outer membrane lipoprotein [Spirosoma sp. KUDC1026]